MMCNTDIHKAMATNCNMSWNNHEEAIIANLDGKGDL